MSSRDISQGIGSIWEQSPPVGQHSAVVLPASAMQVEVLGQQKSEGRLAEHWTYDESPHVESRPKISSGEVDVRGRVHMGVWMARAEVRVGTERKPRRTAAHALDWTGFQAGFIDATLIRFSLSVSCFVVMLVWVAAQGRRVAGRILDVPLGTTISRCAAWIVLL